MVNYPYLKDYDFLKEVDEMQVKHQYVKITLLTFKDEDPIQEIQGRVTNGSISVNGNSSIRRTCNLTFVADLAENDLTNIDNLISANKKFEIEVGFKNTLKKYKDYPIIWFPQGVYIINTVSITHNLSDITINISGKDKMCLLNGECGGTIPAAVNIDEINIEYFDGSIATSTATMYDVIRTVVSDFGGEALGRIIIEDVPLRIKQVMKWNGSSPLYVWSSYNNNNSEKSYYFSSNIATAMKSSNDSQETYENGMNVGYVYTDFTYPGELTANAGDTVVTILDKIKSILGNYEYFYDINGNFIFREIKNYLNTSKATVDLKNMGKQDYEVDYANGDSAYIFNNQNIITSYSNNPQYAQLKNDFVFWGIKKGLSGTQSQIRYHLAIDEKPKVGNQYHCFFYTNNGVKRPVIPIKCDVMPTVGSEGYFYEYNNTIYLYTNGGFYISEIDNSQWKYINTTDWRTELYFQGLEACSNGLDPGYYWAELKEEWPKIYDIENGHFYEEYIKNPSEINYYLDFIDTQSEIGGLSVSNIGRRSLVKTDNDINCIFEPDFPDLVMIDAGSKERAELVKECQTNGQDFIQLQSQYYNAMVASSTYKSAYEEVRAALYQNTSYNETISVSIIPIYHLEPNSRVTVTDDMTGIRGDYILTSYSVPLDCSSTMSLSCKRALQRY